MSLVKVTQGIVTKSPNLAIVNSQEKTHRAENSQAETVGKKNYQKVYIKKQKKLYFD